MNMYEKIKELRERRMSAKRIAATLGITVHTVRYYIKLFNRQAKEVLFHVHKTDG